MVCGTPFFGAIDALFGPTKSGDGSAKENHENKTPRRERSERSARAASILRDEGEY